MRTHSIGVDVGDLRLPIKEAIRRAAEFEVQSVEIPTVSGETSPSQLSSSGRRHLVRYVEGLGLNIAALVADMPALRLTDSGTVDERVARTCEIINLAVDLKVRIVTASVGALTHPQTGDPSGPALEALRRIGEYADGRGLVYAIRPSRDTGGRIVRILDELRCPSIQIGLDPAAMVMSGVDPISAVERLANTVGLFHVRDATAGLAERPGQEKQLGEGDVDFAGILSHLESAAYRGHFIVRRLDSSQPVADIHSALEIITSWNL